MLPSPCIRTTIAIASAVGREVVIPYLERRVPVIADVRVDPAFGSGALKITPAHDPLDFEIGRDHGLPEPAVIGPDGRMSESAGDLAGLAQADADAAVVAWVKERGWLVKREHHRHAVGTCERCHSRIEPLISLQWWCRMEEPLQPAIAALRDRRVRFHPGVAAPVRDRVARECARLVPVAAALVGAPVAHLVHARRGADLRSDGRGGAGRGGERTSR